MTRLALVAALVFLAGAEPGAKKQPIKVLFLGDNGHHQPALRFRQLQPVLAGRGIELVYTDKVEALNPKTLAGYDGLLIYANTTTITPEQEKALLDYVEGGKGIIPLHSASYCFLNSPKYVALVGGQFQRHGTGTFRTTAALPDHPILKGFGGFESWDETYVHHRHNDKDRTILEYRVEGDHKEPWTWVRTQGKGRVFYTAWGHDDRTWGHPGFQNLIERGIRWAVGGDPAVVPAYRDRPQMTARRTDVKPFEFVPAKVPFYPPGKSWGTTTEPLTQMQRPLDPVESMKHMITPVGFEVKLFADETLLGGGKPICMNWDERGRLWVALTYDYPNELQPEGKGRDRIVVLEDTDGDGKADKITVFADKLSIPTSLTFWRGGVVVHQAPHTLYLKDTDGDGKADERRVLFSGWGTGDTHAGPSNLRYGLDNSLYGIVGYSGFDGEVAGEHHRFGQGLYRFRPGGKLEFLRNTNNNSWGVGLSEEGILFASTANGNPSVHLPVPNRYYESVRGWSSTGLDGIAGSPKMEVITDRVRQVDHHGGFTSAAGHALYTARTYPPEYWNRTAFVTEPTGHIVATFPLRPMGASYRSHNDWNLLASDDEWTAPIMAEVGPDGHVWVIDWYNYIVQHNPIPAGFKAGKGGAYETELRDKKHGRIYRVVWKDAKPAAPFTLAGASVEKLVATLKQDNMLWRSHAQRLLVERGNKDVVPALVALAKDGSVDGAGLNPGVIHALWVLHGLGALDGSDPEATAAAVTALHHTSAGVRRNAVQVLPRRTESVKAILDAGLLTDSEPQVRLAALLAVADQPPVAAAGEALVGLLHDEGLLSDRWLSDALSSAAAAQDAGLLPALARARGKPLPSAAAAIIERVAEHHARGEPVRTITTLVAALPEADPAATSAIISGLARGWPRNAKPVIDADTEKVLAALLPKLPPAGRGQLITLTDRWGSKVLDKYADTLVAGFLARARDEKQPDASRIAAAVQLIEFRKADGASARQLLDILTPRTSPELAQGLLDAIARSDAGPVGEAVATVVPGLTPVGRSAALRLLLSRANWTTALLDAIQKGSVGLHDLSLDQKQQLASHPIAAIRERAKKLLARGGGLPNPDREKVISERLALTRRTGDATAGKAVFKTHCAKCHVHEGVGEKIGPDLTGMNVHPKEHLLIDILDPSRSVEGNFRVYTLMTKSGRTLIGLLTSETKTAVELFDAEAKKHTVLRENIDELTASPKSLMPEGFEKQMSEVDLVNLLEFLTQRGKFLPLPLEKAATVVSTRGMFWSEESGVERLIFPDWKALVFEGVPFRLIDPRGDRIPNVILLHGPQGTIPPKMPKSVTVPCNAPAKTIHLLSGVSGWGFPLGEKGSVSMIVRLHYEDGKTEDHPLKNGEHFADYIRRVDVPGSKFAYNLQGRQVRYLAIHPKRTQTIKEVEFVKGPDHTAPVVMAVTVEAP